MKKHVVVLTVLLLVLVCGCATHHGPQCLVLPFEQEKHVPLKHVEPVLTFRVPAVQVVNVKNVVIQVSEGAEIRGFLLCCRQGKHYLPEVASGYSQKDGTVKFEWILVEHPSPLTSGDATFEVTTIGKQLVTEPVLLISTGIPNPESDGLVKPPMENPPGE